MTTVPNRMSVAQLAVRGLRSELLGKGSTHPTFDGEMTTSGAARPDMRRTNNFGDQHLGIPLAAARGTRRGASCAHRIWPINKNRPGAPARTSSGAVAHTSEAPIASRLTSEGTPP